MSRLCCGNKRQQGMEKRSGLQAIPLARGEWFHPKCQALRRDQYKVYCVRAGHASPARTRPAGKKQHASHAQGNGVDFKKYCCVPEGYEPAQHKSSRCPAQQAGNNVFWRSTFAQSLTVFAQSPTSGLSFAEWLDTQREA